MRSTGIAIVLLLMSQWKSSAIKGGGEEPRKAAGPRSLVMAAWEQPMSQPSRDRRCDTPERRFVSGLIYQPAFEHHSSQRLATPLARLTQMQP